MSRKETRRQNDISVITGTVPKPVPQSLAESHSSNIEESASNRLRIMQDKGYLFDGVDCDLSSASSEAFSNDEKEIQHSCNEAKVPGILFVKAMNLTSILDGKPVNVESEYTPKRFQYNPSNKSRPAWMLKLKKYDIDKLKHTQDVYLEMLTLNNPFMNWEKFIMLHTELSNIYKSMVSNDLKFCYENKIDAHFWKLLFYNVKVYLQTYKKKSAECLWTSLLYDGIEFYSQLHLQIVEKYLMKEDRNSIEARSLRALSKAMAQKILICMGDLSRYKTEISVEKNYDEAFKYYKDAQKYVPSNGIPYNQLAIVCLRIHKKFDTVYYYMRSLMAFNSISTAKESLLLVFDEICKKHENLYSWPITQVNPSFSPRSMRKELWIHPMGLRSLHHSSINDCKWVNNEEQNVTNMISEAEKDKVYSDFIVLYLIVIAKLYNGIGLESLHEYEQKLLNYLNILLKFNSSLYDNHHILKMAALNMFILEHNKQEGSRRETRYYAFNFCNQMLGFFLRQSSQMISDFHKRRVGYNRSFKEVNILLQFIKIYFDYLAGNMSIWEPIRSTHPVYINWCAELDQFLALVKTVSINDSKYYRITSENVVLEEDEFFFGFSPLSQKSTKYDVKISPEKVQFHARIRKILKFILDYRTINDSCKILQNEYIILENVEESFQILQTESNDNISGNGSKKIIRKGEKKENLQVKEKQTDCLNECDNKQISEMLKLKMLLERKKHVRNTYNNKFETILKHGDKLNIEVRPKYLLPDTNCFIDSLDDFKKLLREFDCFNLIVPVAVAKELDGLSKGVKLESKGGKLSPHRLLHMEKVSTSADKSLNFIKSAGSNIKFATMKGSFINASMVDLVEEESVSNDNKILATALSMTKVLSKEVSSGDKKIIQTELVLITTDRNLRVKAYPHKLAVSELKNFLKWARDGNEQHK